MHIKKIFNQHLTILLKEEIVTVEKLEFVDYSDICPSTTGA